MKIPSVLATLNCFGSPAAKPQQSQMTLSSPSEAPVNADGASRFKTLRRAAFTALFSHRHATSCPEAKDVTIVHIANEAWEKQFDCKQWSALIKRSGDGQVTDYRIVNLNELGERQFYEVLSGKYGEPLLHPEPERAMALPKGLTYIHGVSGEPMVLNERISGIVVKEDGKVIHRFSLTNAAKQGKALQLKDDGSLSVDGKTYHLYALMMPDKNRTRNYEGFFSSHAPTSTVGVWEKEDLL